MNSLNLVIQHWRMLALTLMVLTLMAIALAPFCNWLFQCGCDWPWNGLADHCNAFIPDSPQKCPWCVDYHERSSLHSLERSFGVARQTVSSSAKVL